MGTHGFVILDKPAVMSSMKAVARVRRAFGAGKAGHGGTLDPLATGVLPVALGEATKALAYILDSDKAYRFTVEFGKTTATLDAEGEITGTSDMIPTAGEIINALPAFTGEIMQSPPAYSAVKIGGRRAYDLARSDSISDLDLAKRRIFVHNIHLDGTDGPYATLTVESGPGFYVRSMARDLASALGTVGYVAGLRRLKAGPFDLDRAVRLDDLENDPGGKLFDVKTALADIWELAVTESEAAKLRQGQRISPRGSAQGTVLLTSAGKPVAVGRADAKGVAPLKVFNL